MLLLLNLIHLAPPSLRARHVGRSTPRIVCRFDWRCCCCCCCCSATTSTSAAVVLLFSGWQAPIVVSNSTINSSSSSDSSSGGSSSSRNSSGCSSSSNTVAVAAGGPYSSVLSLDRYPTLLHPLLAKSVNRTVEVGGLALSVFRRRRHGF